MYADYVTFKLLNHCEGAMPRGRFISRSISLDEKRPIIPIAIFKEIIERDNYTCQYCGKLGTFIYRYGKPAVVENPYNIKLEGLDFYNGNDVISFEIDHIVPLLRGGATTKENLILACRHCNRSKGGRDSNG